MNTLVNYLIESGVSLGILVGIYFLLLRNETFFKWNRLYLMFSVIFSSVLPFIHFQINRLSIQNVNQVANFDYAQNMLETVTVYGNIVTTKIGNIVLSFNMFSLFFTIGVSVFITLFLIRVMSITRLLKKGKIEKQREFVWVRLNNDVTPFSFFNLIFTGNNDNITENNMNQILSHEKVHVRQYHSIDIVIIELLTIFQWWNPFLWILKHVVRENHEYLADQSVLNEGWSKSEYKTMLLQQRLGVNPILANNFNLNLINNRFKMMSKMKSKKISLVKYFTGVIVCSAMIAVFALDVNGTSYLNNSEIQNSNSAIADDSSEVFIIVDEKPVFQGGDSTLRTWINSQIKYPKQAKAKGIQGKVYVSFIVEKDGSVSNVKTLRGVDPLLDAEAIRVIQISKWTPGCHRGKAVRFNYNIPIDFSLQY